MVPFLALVIGGFSIVSLARLVFRDINNKAPGQRNNLMIGLAVIAIVVICVSVAGIFIISARVTSDLAKNIQMIQSIK